MRDKREKLFKAKYVHMSPQNERLNGSWVYGYLSDKNYINSLYADGYGEIYTSEILIDPETVCEYTGLNDHTKWEQLYENERKKFLSGWNFKENRENTKEDWNGRKVFEGDIFQVCDGEYMQRYIIAWDEDSLGWSAQCIGDPDGTLPLSEFRVEEIEVIGNIFDNPELMEEA